MTVEFSQREIGYIIWAMRTHSESPVITEAIEKLLDTLKLGEKVKIISAERIRELEEELMKARTRRFFNNFPSEEKTDLQDQALHKALRPMVQLHKTTPNPKENAGNTNNLTVSNSRMLTKLFHKA